MSRYALPLTAFALTLVARAIVAASRMDALELELYTGSFAWALVQGLPLHPEQMPIIAHLRGSAVFGALLAPLYWLFGPTLGVMKAFAVSWSALGGALLAVVLERAAGRRVAWIGVLLFALAPPAQAMVEVLALGSHADTLPFILAPLALLLPRERNERLTPRRAFAVGLLLGGGIVFSLQTCVAYIGLVPLWIWATRGRGWIARQLACLGGVALLLPLVPFLSREPKLVNRGYGDWFAIDPGSIDKLLRALGHEVRDAWLFADRGVAWAGWVIYAALVAATVHAILRLAFAPRQRDTAATEGRDRLATYALLHAAALFVAYALLDFHVNLDATKDGMGSRYFTPLWPAFAALLALGVDSLWRRRAVIGALAAAALLVASAAGYLTLVDPAVALRQPPVRGTEFHEFRDHIVRAGGDDRLARLEWIELVSPDWPRLRPLVFGQVFKPRHPAFHPKKDPKAPAIPLTPDVIAGEIRALRGDPPAVRDVGFLSLGEILAQGWANDALRLPGEPVLGQVADKLTAIARQLEPREAVWFARGVGRAMGVHQGHLDLRDNRPGKPPSGREHFVRGFRFPGLVPAELRTPVAEGMGALWGTRASPYQRLTLRLLDAAKRGLPPEDLDAWYRGYAWGYRYRFAEGTYRVPEPGGLEALMDDAGRRAFRAALDVSTCPDP